MATLMALACMSSATALAESRAPQRGDAAVYHPHRFTGRPMANGAPFDPGSNAAAHLTLPLGTRAEVTNLRTGARTTVVISDRGPHTPGRILDLSPRSARDLGIRGGVTPVEIRPLSGVQAAR
ncbi:septal ring lytic transglycosylase RlpA family protein [Falsiroseomonas sp. CW058]|uniref:septal ring lytic transglycosylase RlpA family protein n=1 Tax=Falsiroseomonas sp. CW058 TaxID=3388664 RepID=UPI003D320E7B